MVSPEVKACILLPTYNSEGTVSESLSSILNQTHKNFIVKVFDNCSTDNTVELIKAFDDERVQIIVNPKNIGAEANFDLCIENASEDFAAILHADDIYHADFLNKQLSALLSTPAANVVFCKASIFDKKGFIRVSKLPGTLEKEMTIVDGITLFKLVLRHHNFIVTPSAVVRTLVLKSKISCWGSPLYKTSSDLDVWFRFALHGGVVFQNQILMSYRISDSQGSQRERNSTGPSDFLLTMMAHYKKYERSNKLTWVDQRYYAELRRHDKIRIVENLLKSGKFVEAQVFHKNNFIFSDLLTGFLNPRGIVNNVNYFLVMAIFSGYDVAKVLRIRQHLKKFFFR
jgi:glycosyltransferase involved in cell wall biosynthesis